MRRDTAESLRPLLTRQRDVVSTAQLVAHGVDHRVPRRERWTVLAPAVWLAGADGSPDDGQLLIAARLVAGREAVVSGTLVCRLLGLRDVPDHPAADVLVPHGSPLRSGPWVRVRQTRHLPQPVALSGHRAAPLSRAVADAARWCADLQSVRALVLAAVDDGWVGADLDVELRLGGRRGSARLRTALDDVRAGARSAPEAEAADLVRAVRGAPSFVLNPLLAVDGQVVGRPDGWFVGTRLGWEVDSVRHHGSAGDLDRTLRRHGAFADRGLELVHVTPSRLRTDGQRWARDLVQRARRASGEVPGLVVRAPGRLAA